LTEKYEENIEILQSKFINSVTNTKKNKVWEEIAACRGLAPSNPSGATMKIIEMFHETPSFAGL